MFNYRLLLSIFQVSKLQFTEQLSLLLFLCKIPKVEIKHTRPCNLLDPDFRITFIIDLIALVHHVADGRANVGQPRRPGIVIHRTVKSTDNTTKNKVVKPPQASLNDDELTH